MATGSAITYIAGNSHRPLPPVKAYTPHRPWCTDCKRKTDADLLDEHGRCRSCARAVVSRAEAAERRRTEEAAAAAAPPQPPKAGKQGKPTTRRSAPRANQASSNSRRARNAGPATPREKNPPAARETRPAAAGGPRTTTDTARIRRLYLEGKSIPEVAHETGHVPATIRRVLIGSRITLRDDRRTRSGGKKVEHTPEAVQAVRRVYVDEGLSIRQTADKLGMQHKTVTKILERNDIPRRPDAFSPGYQRKDQAAGLKQRIRDLGIATREIKEWAVQIGMLDEVKVGLPTAAIVEAYAAMHAGTSDQGENHATAPDVEQFAACAPASAIRIWATKNALPTGGRGPVPRETRLAYAEHHIARIREAS